MPLGRIENKIYLIRGHRVMVDRDLAELYGVATFNLNKAVRRNRNRFPSDFMFQLTKEEYNSLRFQAGILEKGKHSKYLPYAFTEQGVAMLSSVLRSQRAIQVNVAIMRAFVKLRRVLSSQAEIAKKIEELEHATRNNSADIRLVFKVLKKMLAQPKSKPKRIGFLR
ncbi:ORF6N domain-containing protein [Candidatus Margulisiibacteriota bacterium]